MKKTYETFEEMANDFTNGEFIAHIDSDHSPEICYIWQTAIQEFAGALDGAGMKPTDNPEVYEEFWDKMGDSFKKWAAGMNKMKPPKPRCLGKLTLQEAQEKWGKEVHGRKIVVPSFSLDGRFCHDYYEIIPN